MGAEQVQQIKTSVAQTQAAWGGTFRIELESWDAEKNAGKWANFAGSITMEYVKPMRNPLLGDFVGIFEIVSGGFL